MTPTLSATTIQMSGGGPLRQRGGGAARAPVEDMVCLKVDDAFKSKDSALELVTHVKPPSALEETILFDDKKRTPRLIKNKRKSEDSDATVIGANADGAAAPAAGSAKSRPIRSARRPARSNALPWPLPLASIETKSFGVSQLAPLAVPPRQAHSRAASHGRKQQEFPSNESPSNESAMDAAASNEVPQGENLDPALHTGKRARHNQTERQRVDRLNRLFQKVSVTLDDPEADDLEAISKIAEENALVLAAAPKSDSSKTQALGGKSKAEVLEKTLQTITQLRRLLKEERLARCLDSITMTDTDTALDGTDTPLFNVPIDDAGIDEATVAMELGEEDLEGVAQQPTVEQPPEALSNVECADEYANVTWNAEDAAELLATD